MSAATRLASLISRQDYVALELENMGPTKAGGLPDSSGAIGKNVSHVAYRLSLLTELDQLKALINDLEDQLDNETFGDYEGTVRGVT